MTLLLFLGEAPIIPATLGKASGFYERTLRHAPRHALNAPPARMPANLPALMSLPFRLICLIASVLAVSLAVEGAIVSFHASRSVETEMNSALLVGQQIVKSALAQLPDSTDRRRGLEALVAAFKGNRHLRVSLIGGAAATVESTPEGSHFGAAPSWFVRFLGITPVAARVPIAIAGQGYGSILIETDPTNEILEVWNNLCD
ncbi:MAG: LapD/MoxY N-terminal periplasmic domain-containing protein, partial [Methylocella sp.]